MKRIGSLVGAMLLGVLAALHAAGSAEPAVRLDPVQPYRGRKANPVTYAIDYSVVVTAPAQTKLLRVWLPMPRTDAGQEVERGTLSTFPMPVTPAIATEPVFGNTFAYFEFPKPEGAQIIRHRFNVTVWEMRWDIDPAKVEQVESWPAGFAPFLRSNRTIVVDDRFTKKAREIVGSSRGTARDLTSVMDWLHANMKYDHVKASLRASSEFALENQTGHCSDYHGLCAAFGRALGMPTRMAYGLATFPRSSPSHCKLEAFLPPYGWVVFDVSETQKLVKAIETTKDLTPERKQILVKAALDRLRRGFRDNTWLLQTRGTDYELTPKASRRVNVVRTIHAEADGEPLPDPNPTDPAERKFAWMIVYDVKPDRPVSYPYAGWSSLKEAEK